MDRPLKLPPRQHFDPLLVVSILVLVDRPLKLRAVVQSMSTAVSFNPCSGGSASQTEANLGTGSAVRVSILVLVDRPLKRLLRSGSSG